MRLFSVHWTATPVIDKFRWTLPTVRRRRLPRTRVSSGFSVCPLAHLDTVLHRLYSAGLTLNLMKCHFFKDTVGYLGHVIRPGKLAVAEKNTKALHSASHPTTQTELRSFLGLCKVYQRFIRGFAKLAAPLNALLRKGESPNFGQLNTEQTQAFEDLRARLLDPPILALPRKEGLFTLDTDASQEQIGC